jgi:hypothetical protein
VSNPERAAARIAVRDLLGTPERREVFYRVLDVGRLFNQVGVSTPEMMNEERGRRNGIARALAEVRECAPNEFVQMLAESSAREQRDYADRAD